jgi:plastocyanin
MLMNHRPRADRAYIRYRMTIVTGRRLKAVTPIVWDASHLRQGLVYDVAGGGPPGSLDVRTMTRQMPESGRLVAGLGHVHGGARDLSLSEPTCGGRRIYTSHPTWGLASHPFYNVRPVLHEPGPINMSQFQSVKGIPVVKGQPITLTSRYDNTRPHTRVMGLLLAYYVPDPTVTTACGPLPRDIKTLRTRTPGRARPPVKPIGIYEWNGAARATRVAGPPGPTTRYEGDADVTVQNFAFGPGNLSVPAGATVRWTFADPVLHNLTLASGPEGFSSDRLRAGATFAKTFTRPGTYRFFCELHPVGMIERVVVRPPGR